MDWQDLQPSVDGLISGGVLTLDQTHNLNSPSILALLTSTRLLAVVADVSSKGYQGTHYVVQGAIERANFPYTIGSAGNPLPVTLDFYVQDMLAQITATVTLPSNYTLAMSFPYILDQAVNLFPIGAASMTFASVGNDPPDAPSSILLPPPYKGMSIAGTMSGLAANPLTSSLLWFIPDRDVFPVSGPVIMREGVNYLGETEYRPTMYLIGALLEPLSLGPFRFGVSLMAQSTYARITGSDQSSFYSGAYYIGQLQAAITRQQGIDVLVQMQLLDGYQSLYSFELSKPIPLTSLNQLQDIAALSPGESYSAMIPSEVPTGLRFELNELTFIVAPTLRTLASMTLGVKLTVQWEVIPGVFTLENMSLRFVVPNPAAELSGVVATAAAELHIFDGIFDVSMTFPSLRILGQIRQGTQITYAAVSTALFGKVLELPGIADPTLYELSVDIEPRQQTYRISAVVLDLLSVDLGFVTINLDEVDIAFTYSSLSQAGRFGARFELVTAGNDVEASDDPLTFGFSVSAAGMRTGGVTTWTVEGGIGADHVIPLGTLVARLLGFSVSQDISILDIEDVLVSMTIPSTGPTSFYFEGAARSRWTIGIFGGWSIEIAAAARLERIPAESISLLTLPAMRPLDTAGMQTSGEISGRLAINNFNLAVVYQFAPNSRVLIFQASYKQATLTAALSKGKDAKGQDTYLLKFNLAGVTLGDIITWMVNLARPGSDFSLSAPWDVLNGIDLSRFTLVVDLIQKTVTISYEVNADFLFIKLKSIGLTYYRNQGKGSVKIAVEGSFIDVSYGDGNPPLEWDLLDDPPPAVPGETGLFKLRYLGLGQHISLDSYAQIDTVEQAIEGLRAAMRPPEAADENPLLQSGTVALNFDANSHWLFGADFTALGALQLSMVFNDPYIYGALIRLMGEKAGALAGLRFELLYKKVTDDIGVFKADFIMPDAFRQLEFGEVSITLGRVHVDIYTNGNFFVDLGFPHNRDFSNSFGLQVFPFAGWGGFYLGALTGATSIKVPRIDNGRFDPVIEIGLGLSVGVGKTIEKGPLSAGMTLTFEAIVEGVFADFAPTDRSAASGFFYRVEGTAALVGRVFGKVDFFVIRVDFSAEASARVTLVIEAHQPIYVQIELHIDVRASIKILFVRIHFSFSLTLDLAFTIGHATSTPWQIADDQTARLDLLAARSGPHWPFPAMRPHYKRLVRSTRLLRHVASGNGPSAYGLLGRKEIRHSSLPPLYLQKAAAGTLTWTPANVFPAGKIETLRLLCTPGFTVADPGIGSSGTPGAYRLVLTMGAETSRHIQLRGNAGLGVPSVAHSLQATAVADAPFNLFIEAFLRWGLNIVKTGDQVSAVALDELAANLRLPATAGTGFSYANLIAFLKDNFLISIAGKPTGATPDEVPVAAFPMLPLLSFTADKGAPVAFDQPQYMLTADYRAALDTIFYQLSATGKPRRDLQDDAVAESFAQFIFRECCLMVTQAAVDACIGLLESFAYKLEATTTLKGIVDAFAPLHIAISARGGQKLAHIAALFGTDIERLQALNPPLVAKARLAADDTVVVPVELTVGAIIDDNRDHPLAARSFQVDAAPHQIRGDRSLNQIATDYGLETAVNLVTGQTATQRELLRPDASIICSVLQYTSRVGDTVASIAALYLARRAQLGDATARAALVPDIAQWFAQAVADLNPNQDFGSVVPANTALNVPKTYGSVATTTSYTSYAGDTLDTIADALSLLNLASPPAVLTAYQVAIVQANPSLPNPIPVATAVKIPAFTLTLPARVALDDLAAGLLQTLAKTIGLIADNAAALTPHTVIVLPPFTITTTATDTFAGLAQKYDLGYDALGNAAESVAGIFATAPTATVTLKDLPRVGVEQLISQLITGQGLANQISGQISRFLLHGVRVPSPTDAHPLTAPLVSILDLSGQQFPGPDPEQYGNGETYPIVVSLTDSADQSWISFTATETLQQGETLPALRARIADFDRHNPAAATHPERIRSGLIVGVADVTTLTIPITQADMIAGYPTRTFTPGVVTPLAPLPLYRLVPVRYGVQQYLGWQAGAPIVLPRSGTPIDALTGGPGIWMFPDTLLGAVSGQVGASAAYKLLQVPATDLSSSTTPVEAASYGWATLIPFGARQIARDADPDKVLPNTYGVGGAAAEDRPRLLALYQHLATMTAADLKKVRLSLLHRPRSDTTRPEGLASIPLDLASTYVLKANLTTETRSGAQRLRSLGLDDESLRDIHAAPISDPAAFTGLLWAASITNSGGFYLNYRGSKGEGLPPGIFGKDGGGGEIWLMVLLPDQTTGAPSQRGLYGFNNAAVTGGNLLPADWQLFMEMGTNAPTAKVASVDPGVIAFSTALNNPDLAQPSAARTASELFSLIAYGVAETAAFKASYQALPVGPEESAQKQLNVEMVERKRIDAPADAPYWLFHQGLRIAGQARILLAPNTSGLPPPAQDPYAGIGADAVANLNFQYRDIFGNQTLPADACQNIAFPVGYTDPVVGVGQWPGAVPSYVVAPGQPSNLIVSIGYQMLGALPGMTDPLDGVQLRTTKTIERLSLVYYQMMRPDLAVQLTTTLPVAPDMGETYTTIAKAAFADVVAAAYLFLNGTLQLRQAVADLSVAPTLAQVQGTYRVTAGQIAAINAAVPIDAIFAAAPTVPQFYTFAPGDSAASIVAAHASVPDAKTFLEQNDGLGLTPGKILSAPARTITSGVAGPSLAKLAAVNLCSVGGLGSANATASGCLAPKLTLTFETISLTANDDESLAQLASRFSDALLGLSVGTAPSAWKVTPADLASANAGVAPFFADNQIITIPDALVVKNDTLASIAARHSEYSVDSLSSRNTGVADVFPSGLATLLTATQIAPVQVTLGDFAAGHGLTGDQLVAANGTTLLKTTAPLGIPGMTNLPAVGGAVVAYYLAAGQTLAAAGSVFAQTAEAFATTNQALPNRFSGSPVFISGAHRVQANDADSFATLLIKAEAAGVASTIAELVALIDAQPASLRPRALYTGAAVATPSAMSLQALADLYNVTPSQLALANPGQLRFTAASGNISFQGRGLTVTIHDTLNALSAAFNRIYGIDAPVEALAAANAMTLLVAAGQPLLLPVCAAVASAELDPVNVGYPDSIFKIEVAMTLARTQTECINPNFRDAAAANVAKATSAIPPAAQAQSRQTLSLIGFARQFEEALPHVKIATGRRGSGADPSGQTSPRDLWAVVFGPKGFSSVALDGTNADFYGVRPLWRKLITRNHVMFKEFHDGWDAEATAHSFQSVDIESWALGFLSVMDLMLSPGYAVPLYALDFDASAGVYAKIVGAKQALVAAIGAGVASILAQSPGTDQAAARTKLQDRLKMTLADNYRTTAIVQFPVTVTGTTAHGPARLVGKPLSLRPVTSATTRGLDSLAASFGVWNVYLAEIVAEMPKVLNQQLTITIGASQYAIVPDSTIAAIAAFFGYPTIQAFVAALPQADNDVLFAKDIELNLQGLRRAVSDTPGTFEELAQYFDISVGQVARANANVSGVFVQNAMLAYPGKPDVTITIAAPATTTLLGATQMFTGQAAPSVQALAQANRNAPVIAPTLTAKVVEMLPEHSLSTGKLDLSKASSTVDILFNIASQEQHKKVFLDLAYEISEVEYDIQVVPNTGGYERSEWLSLIIPINRQNGAPQGVSISPGIQEIPVPLRFYPSNPTLLGQGGGATEAAATTLGDARLWTYSSGYRLQMAEQDKATFIVTSNAAAGYQMSRAADDPASVMPLFEALAQFITVYPQIRPALSSLLSDTGNAAAQLAAASAFADMAAAVAGAWARRWAPIQIRLAASTSDIPFPPVPVAFDVTFTAQWSLDPPAIDTVVLTLASDAPTGVVPFPDLTAIWRDTVLRPIKQSVGARSCVYQFQPSAEHPTQNIPAFDAVGYTWNFAGLNVVLQQTAISALEITRNAVLVSQGPTAEAFVYTTPIAGFNQPLLPFVQQGGLIDITGLGANPGSALSGALAVLLAGDPATARAMRLALQYGYELAPPLGGGQPIISNLPIAFLPQFAADQAGDVQSVIDYWFGRTTVSQTNGRILFDLTIYSGMPEHPDRPVLAVQRLEYRLN